jgi:hypothetical protein
MALIDEQSYAANPGMAKRLREAMATEARGEKPVISRAMWEILTPADQSAFLTQAHGYLQDEMTQEDFDRLDPVRRRSFTQGGGVIVG